MKIKRSTYNVKINSWTNIVGCVGSLIYMELDFVNKRAAWKYSPNIQTIKFAVPL